MHASRRMTSRALSRMAPNAATGSASTSTTSSSHVRSLTSTSRSFGPATTRPSQASAAAAAAPRPEPSPNFQSDPTYSPRPEALRSLKRQGSTVDPLTGRKVDVNAMDSSFIGMSGGDIVHEMLRRHDVKTVFGYPGGAILPVFDAIHNSPHFQFILPRHEQQGGHMAEGYARITGKPGVVIVTSGPGATNIVTPLQDALMDGIPLVVITGQVATSAIGSDAFQECDITGITRSCTKHNIMVKNVAEIPRRLVEAFKIATTGRPGPVLVDLPKDVSASILRHAIPAKSTTPGVSPYLPQTSGTVNSALPADAEYINAAAKLINQAKKPLIFAGAGVLSSEDGPKLLAQLSEIAQIPVTTSMQGLGVFDEGSERSLGMPGMHGSVASNWALQEADVIIGLGVRFDDRVTGRVDAFAPSARAAALEGRGGVIHFEVAPKNVSKSIAADVPVIGDVVASLAEMMPQIQARQHTEWLSSIREWKKEFPYTYTPSEKGQRMKPQEVIEELDRQAEAVGKDKFLISTGVGQHQMWACQHLTWRLPRSWVSSGGSGTMGFGLPAAIGMKVAAPEKIVIDIDGDASLQMSAMELQTATQFNIPVKVLVLTNNSQGMVVQWQDLFYKKRYSHTLQANPNFTALAEAMGCRGFRCDKLEDLPQVMKEWLEYDGPCVLDVIVDGSEHVYPMVAAGKALHEQTVHQSLQQKYDAMRPKI